MYIRTHTISQVRGLYAQYNDQPTSCAPTKEPRILVEDTVVFQYNIKMK